MRSRKSSWANTLRHVPSWQPSDAVVQEKLIEMAYTWGDIEEHVELRAIDEDDEAAARLSGRLAKAFRVEAVFDETTSAIRAASTCSFLTFPMQSHARPPAPSPMTPSRVHATARCSATSSASSPILGTAATSSA